MEWSKFKIYGFQGTSISNVDLRRVLLDKVAQAYTEQKKHKQAVAVLELLAKCVQVYGVVQVFLRILTTTTTSYQCYSGNVGNI